MGLLLQLNSVELISVSQVSLIDRRPRLTLVPWRAWLALHWLVKCSRINDARAISEVTGDTWSSFLARHWRSLLMWWKYRHLLGFSLCLACLILLNSRLTKLWWYSGVSNGLNRLLTELKLCIRPVVAIFRSDRIGVQYTLHFFS